MEWARASFAIAIAVAFVEAAPPPAGETQWYAILADDGAWIGHGSRETTQEDGRRLIVESHEMRLKQESGETRILERTETRLDGNGRPASIVELDQTGDSWTRSDIVIGPARAEIVRRNSAGRRAFAVPLPAGTRFDLGDGLLPGWDPAARPRLDFPDFDPAAGAVARVVIERTESRADDPPGAIAARRMTYDGATLVSVVRLVVAGGAVVATAEPFFGTGVTTRPATREEALRSHDAYVPLDRAMVKSPFRIPTNARGGHIRYRFGFRDGFAFPLPETGEQHGARAGDETVLDICPDCGAGLSTDPAYLADALRPTSWLESDDPRIRALAAPAAKLKASGARKMALLLDLARPYLKKIDFVGHYTAVETIRRRAGDCTEAAVLLAALGRAAGIPTRVASGIVYSREEYHGVSNVFMPHSWTLAYVDGAWRSFDLALDTFDSTHIALAIGDGDERSVGAGSNLAALLQWRGMTEVRTRTGG